MYSIWKITSHTIVDFAAEELKKYLRMMMPEEGDIKITYQPEAIEGFRLGVMADFGLDTSQARDVELDDILVIDCDLKGGIIAGSNPRSVLLAVYEYLRQNGCRWLFPGVDGEFVPMKHIQPVTYSHAADSRYRGNCIEGAVSQEILNAYVDFMPKVGLNTFMLQFRVPEIFYERYFGKSNISDVVPTEWVDKNTILQWTRATECEMAKRGIMLHSYGHGFTADPFCGSHNCSGWGQVDISVFPKEKRSYIAMRDGERKLWRGVPTNTNFCMSNPAARADVVQHIANYAENHSNTDFLHIWLADGSNNHCECEACSQKRPADWYVMLMNEADEELTRRSLDTRIVFIVYVDTSWAPLTETIRNPQRFTLMLAPITRDYNDTLSEKDERCTKPYERNKLTMPGSLAEYLGYFDEWKKNFKGANVCFEYHFWIPMNYDLSGIRIAERVYEDCKLYREEGMDGIIECGTQRSFFPHGLGFYTHARALFDAGLTFEAIEEEYFAAAFGKDWKKFRDYLLELEKVFPYAYFYRVKGNQNFYSPQMAENMKQMEVVIAKGRELVREYYNGEVRIQTVSVRILECYNKYVRCVSQMAIQKALGNHEETAQILDAFLPEFASYEPAFRYYVDMHQTVRVMKQLRDCKSEPDTDQPDELKLCIV